MKLKTKFVIFLIFISMILNAQQLGKKISINIQQKPFMEILGEIEKQAGISFSFNSSIIDKNDIITLEIDNVSLRQVLDAVLEGKQVSYKEIGNQIVFYIDENKKVDREIAQNKTPETRVIVINDTIYKYSNTTNIKVYDTLRYVFFDTIRPSAIKEKSMISFDLSMGSFMNLPHIESTSSDFDDFTSIYLHGRTDPPGLGVYTGVNFLFKNIGISAGIGYASFKEDTKYDTDIILPYDKTVTSRTWVTFLDTTYFTTTINPTGGGGGGGGSGGVTYDTTWYYFYEKIPFDTSRIVVVNDTTPFYLKSQNVFSNFSFPINLTWKKDFNKKWGMELGTGPVVNILIPHKGVLFDPLEEDFKQDISEIPFVKLNLSWQANANLLYRLNDDFSLLLMTYYKNGLQSIYSPNYPFSQVNRHMELRVGVRYYL